MVSHVATFYWFHIGMGNLHTNVQRQPSRHLILIQKKYEKKRNVHQNNDNP
jgi:hypothetical protein